MPRNYGLLITLTLVSAKRLDQWDRTEDSLYKQLSEGAWQKAVSDLDADGVREHLLQWKEGKLPAGFHSIVDILHRAGVDGAALLFLRQSQQKGRGVADFRDLVQQESLVADKSTAEPSKYQASRTNGNEIYNTKQQPRSTGFDKNRPPKCSLFYRARLERSFEHRLLHAAPPMFRGSTV